MTATIARYKKALGGFIAAVIPLGAALLAANVLDGNTAHWVAIGCAAGTALLVPLGVAITPANGPKQTVLVDNVKQLLGDAANVHSAVLDSARELERAANPLLTLTPTPAPAPVPVLGGVVAPELEPAGNEGD